MRIIIKKLKRKHDSLVDQQVAWNLYDSEIGIRIETNAIKIIKYTSGSMELADGS